MKLYLCLLLIAAVFAVQTVSGSGEVVSDSPPTITTAAPENSAGLPSVSLPLKLTFLAVGAFYLCKN
ncbi:hypothetical protein TSAR_012975 [Trichomalopsis sarcophagae]|uniref:Uncharacterized protein n=1 Tax=Trichomalopsis sarcophagae TaxID=543379 RepID=A0A232FHU7_9HYME|nr:hypothetical protein TSAR_012975 [Trichomalopsis sarcophagae]